jgi:hypothetical protein
MVGPLRSRLTASVVTVISLLSAVPIAEAQTSDESPELEASAAPDVARPFFVGGGIGVAIRLDGTLPAAFRITEELGLHLDGVPVGPFVALMLVEDISSAYSMQIGVRAGWDLEILRSDISIVVSPSAAVAFAFDVLTPTGDWAYFLAQPALGISLLLLERMLAIWIRPIAVDVYIGQNVHAGWSATAGATVSL